MDIQIIDRPDDVTVIRLRGTLDVAAAADHAAPLHARIQTRHRAAILDLTDVTFISSLGMGTLIAIASSLRRRGHRTAIFGAQPRVASSLRQAGIDAIIPLVDREADALAAIGRPIDP